MFDAQVLAFIGVAFVLTITPGADTMLVLRSVLARGQQAGLWTVLGICSGLFVHATLSALGLSFILMQSATAFEMVKWLGAAYLIFLGSQSIWHALRQSATDTAAQPQMKMSPSPKSYRRSLLEGLFSNVLNPKVSVFYLAFLPQFIQPYDLVLAKSLLLAAIHFMMGIIWLTSITILAGRVRTLLAHHPIQRSLEAFTGAVLILFGTRLALERH